MRFAGAGGDGFSSLAQAGSIDAIEAFGESLSDDGNIFLLSGGTTPGPPYVGGQFSNGNVWVEDLAISLALARLLPALRTAPTTHTATRSRTPRSLTPRAASILPARRARSRSSPLRIREGRTRMHSIPSGSAQTI
jgi:hypothetical protein